MSDWDAFPSDYRDREVATIIGATRAGECVSVLGLSGAGKSNLMGYLAHRRTSADHSLILVDCNRLIAHTPQALFHLIRRSLSQTEPVPSLGLVNELDSLSQDIGRSLEGVETMSLLLDRFDVFAKRNDQLLFNSLRALRDSYKYQLAYVIATRRPQPEDNELAELFHAHTFWLGPLNEKDARWNVRRYADRLNLNWDEDVVVRLIVLSGGYPSLLRALCEAYASGASDEALIDHPAVTARIDEFWRDNPGDVALSASGLTQIPLLARKHKAFEESELLTAKEQALFNHLKAHPDVVCEKDDLIRSIWPEDAIYEQGVRDSSLAQLVRRLRLKIEPDPADPYHIQTVAGRGYIYRP